MSELAKSSRKAMKEKAARLAKTDPKQKVDASGYSPPDALDADVKTGARPIQPRLYKRGGKLVRMSGGKCAPRADRKKRKNGGNALATPNNIINRNVREANEEREGVKHRGGFKKGGRVHKMSGGDVAQALSPAYALHKNRDKKAVKALSPIANLKKGGRIHKMGGGYAKGGGPSDESHVPRELFAFEGGKNVLDRMKRGGATKHADKKADTAQIKEALHKHEKQKHPGSKLTKLAKGGSTSLDGSYQGTRPKGGRIARKSGGRAGKGKVNVNIIIDKGGSQGAGLVPPMGGLPPPMMPPPGGPPGLPPGMMPPGGPPGMPPGLPPGMPPMPRKSGGRAMRKEGGRLQGVDKPGKVGHRSYRSTSDMDAGSLSGLGRLEKAKIYGKQK